MEARDASQHPPEPQGVPIMEAHLSHRVSDAKKPAQMHKSQFGIWENPGVHGILSM